MREEYLVNNLETLHKQLYSLVLNCEFLELKKVLNYRIIKDENLVKEFLKKYSFSYKGDIVIGLICCGQKEIIEMLFHLHPDHNFWYVYIIDTFSQNSYYNEFLDFLLIHIGDKDYDYADEILSAKLKWAYYNREFIALKTMLEELKSPYGIINTLEELWSYSIKAEQFNYTTLFFRTRASSKYFNKEEVIEDLIQKYLKDGISINIYVYLFRQGVISDKFTWLNPMTEDYFNQLNISDYQNLAQLESELRIPIKSLEYRYIRQLLQASIKGQHVLLTTQLTKLVFEVNEFDNKTLLESSNTDIIKRLSDLNLKLTIHHPKYFLNAISKGDNVLIDAYVLLGINVRREYDEALIFATYHGHIELVEKLIKLGCHIHTENPVILTLTTSASLMTFWLQHYDFPKSVIKYALLYHSLNTSGCYSLIKALKNQLKSEKILKYSFVLNLEAKDYLTAHALVKEEGVNPGCLFGISQLYKEEFLKVNRCPSYHELSGEWKQTYDTIFANANPFTMPISKMFKNPILFLIKEKMK